MTSFFSSAYFDYKDESGFPKPPSYNVATTLPSYDEAERTKAEATIPLVPGRVSIVCHLEYLMGSFMGVSLFLLPNFELLGLIRESSVNFKQIHY